MTAIAEATPDTITTETVPCIWCKGTGTHEFNDPWITAELGEQPGPRPCTACDGTGTYTPPTITDDDTDTDEPYEPDYEPDDYDDPYEADRAADRYERWLDSLWP